MVFWICRYVVLLTVQTVAADLRRGEHIPKMQNNIDRKSMLRVLRQLKSKDGAGGVAGCRTVPCRAVPGHAARHSAWRCVPHNCREFKGTQAWNFFKYFFCRNRNHMVPRACNKRFLKIEFELAEIFDISAYAQHAMKSVPSILSMRWNSFRVCSVCDKIRSAYAQHRLYM